jgi:hypothetical protein
LEAVGLSPTHFVCAPKNIQFLLPSVIHTDQKGNKIFLVYEEIQMGAVAKSYMRKGFPIYEKMRKYLTMYEEAVSHI